MGFYWKFTRSGARSGKYVSLIIDVDPNSIDQSRGVWNTSFEELEKVLVLLHDVEVYNKRNLCDINSTFYQFVHTLGYEPTMEYITQREQMGLVIGQCVMGRHIGIPLDWGRYAANVTSIELPLSCLYSEGSKHAGFISADTGIRQNAPVWDREDKLSCYRNHPEFQTTGEFFDLMPLHQTMVPIVSAMKQNDPTRTDEFVQGVLKWRRLLATQFSIERL